MLVFAGISRGQPASSTALQRVWVLGSYSLRDNAQQEQQRASVLLQTRVELLEDTDTPLIRLVVPQQLISENHLRRQGFEPWLLSLTANAESMIPESPSLVAPERVALEFLAPERVAPELVTTELTAAEKVPQGATVDWQRQLLEDYCGEVSDKRQTDICKVWLDP
jgi:hypothetical protein